MEVKIQIDGTNKTTKSKRQYKSESLLKFVNDYIVIDIETTGFDPYYDEIIEIGAIKISDQKVIGQFNKLVKPDCRIREFISEKTGITNDMVEDAPRVDEVLPEFMDFIKGSIIIGHNVNFDINFLYDNSMTYLNIPLDNDFIDTLRISRKLFKDFKNHQLSTLLDNFNICSRGLHRSIVDCTCTKDVYEYMRQYVYNNNIDISEAFKKNKRKYTFKKLDMKSISSEITEFDESHLLYGRNVVFTGVLEKMVRKEAAQHAANLGAICQNGINKQTNILILGNNDYCPSIVSGKSTKQKKAEQYILAGHDLIIISENVFYDMVLEE